MMAKSHAFRWFDVSALTCYGCAHSASPEPPPGKPSGERPCCFCVRNPDREEWAEGKVTERSTELKDNKGNPRDFNPWAANLYNGAPAVYNPMDCYVTLDHRDQERFFDENPDYGKAIRVIDGIPTIMERNR